jgi:hypothetical protein
MECGRLAGIQADRQYVAERWSIRPAMRLDAEQILPLPRQISSGTGQPHRLPS